MNALVHRDYFKHNVQTQIKIFDDHIWIFNVGELPEGITIEQLKSVHAPVPRNPLIVRTFYLAGLIEELGSGIKRMMDSLNDMGLPEPEFKEEFGGFSIYIWKTYHTEEKFREIGLNERQIKAMDYIKEKGSISLSDYSKLSPEVKDRTLRRDLNDLTEKGLLKAIGEKKGRRYELVI